MNCIYLKQKLNRKLECKKDSTKDIPRDCYMCQFRELKSNIRNYTIKKNNPNMRQKTTKLSKLENKRESLFTDDMKHCIICGKSPVNKHEIFGGRNRINSIRYKLVIPLCNCEHHDQINCRGIHFDKKLQDYWHKKGQAAFEEAYPNLKFIDIFKRNYF